MCSVNESTLFHHNTGDLLEFISENFTIRADLEKVTLPFWFLLGVPGALLSLIVWTRPALRQSSGVYLAALAIADVCFFLVHVPWYLDSAWHLPVLEAPVVCELFALVNLFFQYMSPMLTLGFTIERYIAVCHPFLRDRLCTTARAVRVTLGMTVGCLLLSTPQAYFFHYQEPPGVCKGRPEIGDSATWQHHFYSFWSVVTEVVIFGFVPIGVLTFNVLVIREMRRLSCKSLPAMSASRVNKGRTTRDREMMQFSSRAATTWMLLCVSFYQIFATLPLSLCQIMLPLIPNGDMCLPYEDILGDPKWRYQIFFLNIRAVIEALAFSHYAAKFYICLACGRIFRRELGRMFTRKRESRKPTTFKRLLKRPSV